MPAKIADQRLLQRNIIVAFLLLTTSSFEIEYGWCINAEGIFVSIEINAH